MPTDTQPAVVPPTPAEFQTDRAILLGRLAAAITKIDQGRANVEEWSRWLPGDSGAAVRPLLDAMRAKLAGAIASISGATDYDAMLNTYREALAGLLALQGQALTGLAAQVAVPGLRYTRQMGIAVGEGARALGGLVAEAAAGLGEGLGLGTIAAIGIGLYFLSQAKPGERQPQG